MRTFWEILSGAAIGTGIVAGTFAVGASIWSLVFRIMTGTWPWDLV